MSSTCRREAVSHRTHFEHELEYASRLSPSWEEPKKKLQNFETLEED